MFCQYHQFPSHIYSLHTYLINIVILPYVYSLYILPTCSLYISSKSPLSQHTMFLDSATFNGIDGWKHINCCA
jgi:hypothetical protein